MLQRCRCSTLLSPMAPPWSRRAMCRGMTRRPPPCTTLRALPSRCGSRMNNIQLFWSAGLALNRLMSLQQWQSSTQAACAMMRASPCVQTTHSRALSRRLHRAMQKAILLCTDCKKQDRQCEFLWGFSAISQRCLTSGLCTVEVPSTGQAAGCAIYTSHAEQGLCPGRQRRDAKQPHRQCSERPQHSCRRRGAQPAYRLEDLGGWGMVSYTCRGQYHEHGSLGKHAAA